MFTTPIISYSIVAALVFGRVYCCESISISVGESAQSGTVWSKLGALLPTPHISFIFACSTWLLDSLLSA